MGNTFKGVIYVESGSNLAGHCDDNRGGRRTILAVQVERYLQRLREAKNRKLDVFRRLMVTRAAIFVPNHIDAINLIDAEYDSRKESDKAVLDAWREYWDHLNRAHGTAAIEASQWEQRRADALGELLFAMSNYLKLGIDRSVLKRPSYYPQYYGNLDADNAAIRKGAVEMLSGTKAMKVQIVPEAPAPEKEN